MRRDRALNTSMWDVMLSIWYQFSNVSYETSVSIHEVEEKLQLFDKVHGVT